MNFSDWVDLDGENIRIDGLDEGGGSLTQPPPEACMGFVALQKDILMIFFVAVSIKEIVENGRDFPWPRLEVCLRCAGRRVRLQGFSHCFFHDSADEVFLRRYRCPECRWVMRARPVGYFERVQASVEKVRSSIAFRLEHGRWPSGGSRRSASR